ncbi:hypothetical protein FisN_20Lh064 [Fistulifera solaris]|uniref:Uncharacterized protein n=1 Tax=Fistulifera solaris TaxID=1519565 RepID=A0A1Z5JDM2_FISSO|nr:hypothetical protein FisN_20Lh064 [Fistulifera solaris]|eukprot:GAX11878.1 hypothetical protein FisN_20Lh064 [Fistulifera solaris]
MNFFALFLFSAAASVEKSFAFATLGRSRSTAQKIFFVFTTNSNSRVRRFSRVSSDPSPIGTSSLNVDYNNLYESTAAYLTNVEDRPDQLQNFVNWVTILRVVLPSLGLAASAKVTYSAIAMVLANWIDDSGVFAVVAQDASQFIQNILTTSGLVFALLLGQTYYFMYQQQEAIYLALFAEVTMAKSLLEQIALVSQGRKELYSRMLFCMHTYVHEDLTQFTTADPAVMISAPPSDDPLEDILYLTSVGEPSIIYQTVRSLRQARAQRLGALQRKLPELHMPLLWTLFAIVLFTFPLLGAGSQTIGGSEILAVQSWYLSFLVFGMGLTIGVVNELQRPSLRGAYNAQLVLNVMATGLIEEIDLRLSGQIAMNAMDPSIDSDGSFDEDELFNL